MTIVWDYRLQLVGARFSNFLAALSGLTTVLKTYLHQIYFFKIIYYLIGVKSVVKSHQPSMTLSENIILEV